jgi:hypothetical protein
MMSGSRFDTRYQLFFCRFFVKAFLVLGDIQSYRWIEVDGSCSKPVSNQLSGTRKYLY